MKKRKLEKLLSCPEKVKTNESTFRISPAGKELTETALPSDAAAHILNSVKQNSNPRKSLQKLLLPKPKMALVSVPVMQLAHLPVLLPSPESGALRSVVLAVNSHGSVGTLHLLPHGAVVPQLGAKSLCFKEGMSTSLSSLGSISTGVQVSLGLTCANDLASLVEQRGRSTSTNIQTGKSYLSEAAPGAGVGEAMGLCSAGDSSVSSCSQTDISVSAQVLLPVSVETQTFSSRTKATSSIAAQTDGQCVGQVPCSSSSVPPDKTMQTSLALPQSDDKAQQQAILCAELFGSDSLSVSTQTALDTNATLAGSGMYEDSKSTGGGMCFGVQADELNSNNMADNQTQTMTLLNDLENILSDSMSGHQVLAVASGGCGSVLGSVQEQHNAIDFDFEEFLNAVQTQTEESELGGLGGDMPLESLDIQTQTDFLLMDELDQGEAPSPTQASVLELFDTQTQTDLDFLLNAGSHMALSSILRHSSFSMSTESSDTETQTDLPLFATGLSAPAPASQGEHEHGPLLSSTETQTATGQAEGLGHLFLTSNETQTAMDDFLSADLAWNMESHFSSVETQTCEELRALFQHPEKPNS